MMPADDTELEEDVAVGTFAALQHVERTDGRHDKGRGDDGRAHVVRVFQPGPGIQEQLGEAGDLVDAVGSSCSRQGAASRRW